VVQRFAWDDDARRAAVVCSVGEVRAAGVPLMEHPKAPIASKPSKDFTTKTRRRNLRTFVRRPSRVRARSHTARNTPTPPSCSSCLRG